MTVAAASGDARGLVALLEDEITPLVAAGGAGVEPKVWEQALTGLARELLARPGKQFRARLVEMAFLLAGGNRSTLSPRVPLLVELLHAGSLIVDDIQDDSPVRRGGPALHVLCGMPLALNTGNWLYFAAFELAGRLDLCASRSLTLYQSLSRCLFRCHQGQALDLSIDVSTLRQRDLVALADAAAALKTGALVGFAAELGAIAAGADDAARASLASFGNELGVALQRLDDAGGLLCPERAQKGHEDLACGRLTWVWGRLASELDEIHFASLQARLRRARSERGGARRAALDAIAGELATLIDETAKVEVSRSLETALAKLGESFPSHPVLDSIASEIARLKESYD